MKSERVMVIGGGLAGCEAVWRLTRHGLAVDLFEMKPEKFSPAHSSSLLGELVCSNSLRSAELQTAVGLLKEEMRRLGSLVMTVAEQTSVPAGKALAVDREKFAAMITERVENLPRVRIIRQEITKIDPQTVQVLATGPLTSEDMSRCLSVLIGSEYLYFYDAIAPIVTAESVNMAVTFWQSRYGQPGAGDYLNCPMTKDEYLAFYEALMAAEKTPAREFERPKYFEGCLPIEVMADRGPRTLTFGPLKPVGLIDPRTGRRPYAVVQLRRENEQGSLYNLVGCQTRLTRPEQDRIFRMIPGLEKAVFVRWGSVHRNTFIHGPRHLSEFLHLKSWPKVFLAGQLTGVEGYVESAAMGVLAGENAARMISGHPLITPPRTTTMGALVSHLTDQTPRQFQPSNVNFGLIAAVPPGIPKGDRAAFLSQRSLKDLSSWMDQVGYHA